MPCYTNNLAGIDFEFGCSGAGGWLLNIPRTALNVFAATETTFTYLVGVNASAAIPISNSLGLSCTLNVSAPQLQADGTAVFSSSIPGGTTNRLQLSVTSVDSASVDVSGCGIYGDIVNLLKDIVWDSIRSTVTAAHFANFCGAEGPELFGTCP